jgi:hypothetical protein
MDNLPVPEEYGGLGVTMEEESLIMFEMGRTSPAFRSLFGTTVGIGSQGILIDGTQAQKDHYLPKLASGELTASFALTEPEAGSDAGSLRTSARKPTDDKGDHYIVNGSKRFITVTLGTGIGGGIVHNGKIFHGANGMAGEVGHMSIVYGGEPCPCGRRGCWERYASAQALKRMTAQAVAEHSDSVLAAVVRENGGHISGRSAFEAMRRGDQTGKAVCEQYIDYLAAGIINLVNIFQPDTLAIGGGVSNEDDRFLLDPLRRRVERESIPCSRDKMTKIVKAELGNRAGIIGAAFLGKNKRV